MTNSNTLVIGCGIAGITSALELAKMGYKVYMVEKNTNIGGKVASFCCKASSQCNKCSVCLITDRMVEVRDHTNIQIMTDSEVIAIEGKGGDFTVKVNGNVNGNDPEESSKKDNIKSLSVGTIIVAIGIDVFEPRLAPQYGYGKYKNVMTALELEKFIYKHDSINRPSDGAQLKRIAFIQCVGSRNIHFNKYCSKVCCMYATKLSEWIHDRIPDADVTIFYMDFQTFGKGFMELYDRYTNEDWITFIRSKPAEVYQIEDDLYVRYEDTIKGEIVEDTFDIVVLSTGITPKKDHKSIARLFGLELDVDGFFSCQSSLETARTNINGVFLAGGCQSPKDISETISQASLAAADAALFLERAK